MKRTFRKGSGQPVRVLAVLATGVLVLGMSPNVHADEAASRTCRKTIGKELGKLSSTQLKLLDKCYKSEHKLNDFTGVCNVVGSALDPDGKYAAAKTGANGKLDAKCLAGDPVLDNYQPGTDPLTDAYPLIEAGGFGNNILVAGTAKLGDPKAAKVDIKCNETIGKNRSKMWKEILKEASKCQDTLDKTGTTFGALDVSCVKPAAKALPKATAKITSDCNTAGASTQASGCTPLPGCATDNITLAAQQAARDMYSNLPTTADCGNNVVEFPEQCEPPGTATCSATCERIGLSCDEVPAGFSPNPIQGTRSVKVAIGGLTSGQKLAGVQINLGYPPLQAGVSGTGQSSIVQGKVAVLQGIPGDYISIANDTEGELRFVIGGSADFIDNGDLIDVAMDACQPLSLNFCNRNQQVMGCCDASTDVDGDTVFQECVNRCFGGGSKNNTVCATNTDCLDPVTLQQGVCTPGGDNPPVCPGGSFSTTSVSTPTVPPALEDCCPADNACTTQTQATNCTVSDPVDSNGLPVEGVTCSVSITGF